MGLDVGPRDRCCTAELRQRGQHPRAGVCVSGVLERDDTTLDVGQRVCGVVVVLQVGVVLPVRLGLRAEKVKHLRSRAVSDEHHAQ